MLATFLPEWGDEFAEAAMGSIEAQIAARRAADAEEKREDALATA